MLVAFALENYTCFRDRQELNFQAVSRASDLHAFDSGCPQAPRLNRVTAVYGPNGSGKSRLLQALLEARYLVVHSLNGRGAGERLPHTPFLFDTETREKPTTYETCFIEDGTYYEYRFSHDHERIHAESLFAWPPGGRKRRLVERRWQAGTRDYSWRFGKTVTGLKDLWRRCTRPDALFVSVATQLNSGAFEPIFAWFRRLAPIPLDPLVEWSTAEWIVDDATRRKRVLEMLQDADIQVSDLIVEREPMDAGAMRKYFPPAILKERSPFARDSMSGFRTRFAHPVRGASRPHLLDLGEESLGTRRMFALAGPWLDMRDRSRIFIVDELDRSLHPILLDSLLRQINDGGRGGRPHHAQLICALHDTTQMARALSRGQVWFAEKDRTEAAALTPLSDYRPRKGEAVGRAYLAGRYRGIPVTRALQFEDESA